MRIKIVILLQFLVLTAVAQKQPNILNWKADVSLNTYLVHQMHQQYDAREIEFKNALISKQATLAYIQNLKQKFKTVLGALPEKAALAAKTTGVIETLDYRIEKVVYQSFENHHVTANLYVPKGKGKFPAVLFFCGHEDLSKATETYQKTAALFAQNGFIVLVVDPISQGERVQLTDENGKALTRGSTTEHTLLNQSSNLLGTSVAAYELFDNIRSLDYLVTRPEVDIDKIGCIGNSGGAMQAIYFAAVDERIKVVAPCSYLASRENTLATAGAADGCAQIPNEGMAQLEMSDYLIAAAPKPILVLAGRYDFIDYNGTLQSVEDLKKVYQMLNAPEKLKLFSFDDGHGLSKPKREVAVQWFRQWFYNDPKPVSEKDIAILTDKELFATAKGKVSTSYLEEINILQRNLQLFTEKAASRKAFAQQPLSIRKEKIISLLGLKTANTHFEVENVGQETSGHANFDRLILRFPKEVPLALRMYTPKSKAKKVVIWFGDKSNKLDSIRAEMQTDNYVIFADLRGTGETADKPELNDPKYFSNDYRNAMLALHMGKPLVGQRTQDILNLIEFLKSNPKMTNLPIEINAVGLVGIPALHAAFLSPAITKVQLMDGISSYKEMISEPIVKDRNAAVIHDVLSYYDLQDLVNWIGGSSVVKL